MNGPPTAPVRLGELLVRAGSIQPAELEQALAFQRTQGGRIGAVLVRLGALSEDSLYRALAEQLALPLQPLADLSPDGVRAGVAALGQPASWWLPRAALPWLDDAGVLFVAAADPLEGDLREAVDAGRGARAVCWCLAQPAALDRWQQTLRGNEMQVATDLDARALREMAEDAPVIAFVNNVLAQAVDARASDIHFEPGERDFDVRFRIDGVLQARGKQPMSRYPAISSRLKLVSGLDIAERRLPQDGRTTIRVAGQEMDVRVSAIPAVHGESLVLRLLPKRQADLALPRLGMEADHLALFQHWLRWPNGLVLVTGPTGSGKSTTLYSALTAVNDLSRKIVTVEDPVEFRLPDVVQIQTQAEIGYTFARALRSILRHDPDIIMVGEIRDRETAEIAVQSALTGHLVLATLHTNDALSAVTRMVDMGIEPYLVAAALRATMAQRLVRRLCPQCAEPAADSSLPSARWQALAQRLPQACAGIAPAWYHPRGCTACQGTGFRGRLGIYELVPVSADMQHAVAAAAPAAELVRLADAAGRRSLADDGLLKAAQGLTTLEEVLRASGGAGQD